jgi:hypothetical protein
MKILLLFQRMHLIILKKTVEGGLSVWEVAAKITIKSHEQLAVGTL